MKRQFSYLSAIAVLVVLMTLTSCTVNAQTQYPYPLVPVAGNNYPSIQEPTSFAWPAKHSVSLDLAIVNPRNLAGMTVVVTGDSTKWGQGNAIARLLKNSEKMKVYGFSRKSKNQVYNCTWEHFSGDLRNEADVIAFVAWLKIKGVKRVDAVFLNAGVMMNLFPQDISPVNIQKGPIDTNFFGNYNMYYYLLRAGLLPVHKDVRIIWTGSIAETTHFSPLMSYGVSKAMINNFVKQSAVVEKLLGLKLKHFVNNPFGVSTQIACNNQQPILINQLCANVTQSMIGGGTVCNDSFVPDPSSTTAEDVALFYRIMLRDPNPKYRVTLIESSFPLDQYGGKWDRWHALWYQGNPIEYAQEWLNSAFQYFFPSCAVFPA